MNNYIYFHHDVGYENVPPHPITIWYFAGENKLTGGRYPIIVAVDKEFGICQKIDLSIVDDQGAYFPVTTYVAENTKYLDACAYTMISCVMEGLDIGVYRSPSMESQCNYAEPDKKENPMTNELWAKKVHWLTDVVSKFIVDDGILKNHLDK